MEKAREFWQEINRSTELSSETKETPVNVAVTFN